MQRASQEGYVSPDGLSAGKAADGLVYHCLEDGGGQVFLGGPFVDQGLDIRFCKYAAAGGDGIDCLVVFCVFVQSFSICF